MNELSITQEQLQKKVKKVKKAKYRKFVNESSSEDNETEPELARSNQNKPTYGTISETTQP